MANLVAIVYPDEETAAKALGTLGDLQKQAVLSLEDACYVVKDQQGKVKIHQMTSTAGAGAVGGAWWGFLIGLLFFVPIAGLAIGAGLGALMGKFADYGIDDKFVKQLRAEMKPGNSALFMMVRSATADKAVPELAKYGGTILRTSLSNEAEAKLQKALEEHGQAAPTENPTAV